MFSPLKRPPRSCCPSRHVPPPLEFPSVRVLRGWRSLKSDKDRRIFWTALAFWASPAAHHPFSAELSHTLKVSDLRRNTPKSVQNRSESLCRGLWAPCRSFWAWFGPALGPNPARNRGFRAGSFKVFGALLAQPSCHGGRLVVTCPGIRLQPASGIFACL